MTRGNALPFVFGAVIAALLVLVVVMGSKLTGSPPPIPLQTAGEPIIVVDISDLMAASDQVVTMLTAVTIALYVLLGFSFQQALSDPSRSNFGLVDVVAGVGFVGSTFLSFYFGYVARATTFEFAAFGYADEVSLRTSILWNRELFSSQALLVTLAAVFAFFLVLRTFVTRDAPQSQSKAEPNNPKDTPKATKLGPLKVVESPGTDTPGPNTKPAPAKSTERRVV